MSGHGIVPGLFLFMGEPAFGEALIGGMGGESFIVKIYLGAPGFAQGVGQ